MCPPRWTHLTLTPKYDSFDVVSLVAAELDPWKRRARFPIFFWYIAILCLSGCRRRRSGNVGVWCRWPPVANRAKLARPAVFVAGSSFAGGCETCQRSRQVPPDCTRCRSVPPPMLKVYNGQCVREATEVQDTGARCWWARPACTRMEKGRVSRSGFSWSGTSKCARHCLAKTQEAVVLFFEFFWNILHHFETLLVPIKLLIPVSSALSPKPPR